MPARLEQTKKKNQFLGPIYYFTIFNHRYIVVSMIQCIKSTHQQFLTIAVICTIFQVIVFSSLYGSLEQIAKEGRRSIVFLMRMCGEARVTENGSVDEGWDL